MEVTFHKQSGHTLTVEAFVSSQSNEQLWLVTSGSAEPDLFTITD